MFNELLQQFMGSPQGAAALQTLRQQHGLDPATAQRSMSAATVGAAQALHQADGGTANPLGNIIGMLGGGAGGNAIAGALSGMLGGGGLQGALQGGLSGVLVGRVAEAIATRTGMNPQAASAVAATLAPHILEYVQHRGAATAAATTAPGGGVTMQPMGGPQYGAPMPAKDPNAPGKTPSASAAEDTPPWKRAL